ncbi:hypothetical protein NHP200010_11470 [Helicobacter bizzozeronii]|nr:hypothetical protein NHP200010_11470 [Helicobacter bizzozeronii]
MQADNNFMNHNQEKNMALAFLQSLLTTLCLLSALLNPIHAFNLNLAIYEEYFGPRADACPGDLIK